MIKRIIDALKLRYVLHYGGEKYLNYLRSKGVKIGKGTTVGENAASLQIDISRPYLLEIGDNCRLNTGLVIMTHDFATMVFKNKYGELIPCSGKVKIGNNVYFGRQCTVLKGVTIGDNCIIGYGAVVMKDIPANSVVVGRPAKVVCTLDEYYEKRKKKGLEESLELAREIQRTFHRRPIPEDFREEFVYFVSGDEVDKYPTLNIERELRSTGDCYEKWVSCHVAPFKSFEDFLQAAGI